MWYYMEDGQQRGPVLENDFEALRRGGEINAETFVWREGMTDWQTLGQAEGRGGSAVPGAPPPMPPGAGEAICSQCGGRFPASEVIHYGGAPVCAACKPIFLQKLREGARVGAGPMVYAGFWIRFAAYFLDGIVTGILGMIIGAVVGFIAAAAGGLSRQNAVAGIIVVQLLAGGLGFAVRAAYFIFFTGKSGQTPGKMVCKLRVVNADGTPVSYGKATGRFFGYILSSLILCIGFMMVGWDDEKRALHDRLCDTRVIKVG